MRNPPSQPGDLSFGNGDGSPLPELPEPVMIDLEGRGTVRVRDLPGPHDNAPAVILLHGWTATVDLNYFTCYEPLAERYRVVAYDQHGHAHGHRSRKPFRIADAADDAAAIADQLGIDRFIVIGYSMGGAVAQVVWQRHRERLDGLILAATAPYFAGRREERWSFAGLTGLAALARVTPSQAQRWITDQFYLQRKESAWGEYAMQQVSLHDWRTILEAGKAIGEFSSSDWIGEVDVPTSILITMRDQVVPLRRQIKLWQWIPHAEAYRVDCGHDGVVMEADRFVPQLVRAIESTRSPSQRSSVR